MLFNSVNFFIFFAVFFVGYFALKERRQLVWLLVASYVFYGCWDWRFLILIAGFSLVSYRAALMLERSENKAYRKRILVVSSGLCLACLGFFKYANFFIGTASELLAASGLGRHEILLSLVLPVGISFYTFEAISYLVDVYRRNTTAEKSMLIYFTYLAFFPHLVAGPIVRPTPFMPQLRRDHRFSSEAWRRGLVLCAWGYTMKVVVADSLAPLVDARFAAPEPNAGLSMLLGVIFYAFQIYGDFAGYSMVAIGIADILGYHIPANFNRPYLATDFSDFWRRWHISLSSWLRDYLYIPLGGNRSGGIKNERNLILTMLLGGLWHGASWTFVLWGLFHGLLLVVQRHLQSAFGRYGLRWLFPSPIRIIAVFILVCFGWILFRSNGFIENRRVLASIFTTDGWSFSQVPQKYLVIKGVSLMGLLFGCDTLNRWIGVERIIAASETVQVGFIVACGLLIVLFGTFTGNAFIYFQF